MNKFVDLILIEGVAMHRLLSDGAVRQPFRGLLHEVKYHGAFAEAIYFQKPTCGAPQPQPSQQPYGQTTPG